MVSPDNVEQSLRNLSLSASSDGGHQGSGSDTDCDNRSLKWHLPLKELYKMACAFYKEKSGKAIHLSYEDNLKLVAFTQQAAHGPLDPSKAPPLGMFDVIGKDRRIAWQHLGTITKLQAMEGFIDLLDRLCPQFKPYVEAIKKDREQKAQQAQAEEARRREQVEKEKEKLAELKRIEDEKNREEIQRRQLQDALNQQTYHQFKDYAEKQFPGNPEQQAVLIRQLQNEHYHQYMQQLQAQVASNYSQMRGTSVDSETAEVDGGGGAAEQHSGLQIEQAASAKENSQLEYKEQCDSDDESGEYAVISPANMWTKPDVKLFKQEVTSGKGDGVIRVGHGDTITVRVPTHEGGSSLFWEFATDNYDIGFGVYFEWGKPMTTDVSVHVSESDEDDDTLEDDDVVCADDLECGGQQQHKQQYNSGGNGGGGSALANRNPISIIVPIYRRECQTEVYAGSHSYPGEGTYLLKFDNSYSLWRSKTLYYKVFYTR